jgi:hypothetical protein
MTSRTMAFCGLVLGSAAALGAQALSYGLVYPAATYETKAPLAAAVLLGALTAMGAAGLCLRALRRSSEESERFFARLGIMLSCFFLFVILAGFGIPNLFLGPKD